MRTTNTNALEKSSQAGSVAIEQIGNLISNMGNAEDAVRLPDSAEGGARLLKRALRAKKKNIIGIGRLFHAVKSVLGHGEWSRVWELQAKPERPPITKRHGDDYALVGQEFG